MKGELITPFNEFGYGMDKETFTSLLSGIVLYSTNAKAIFPANTPILKTSNIHYLTDYECYCLEQWSWIMESGAKLTFDAGQKIPIGNPALIEALEIWQDPILKELKLEDTEENITWIYQNIRQNEICIQYNIDVEKRLFKNVMVTLSDGTKLYKKSIG